MIKILRASAGSGKTHNLAETYIRILLSESDPSAYRHILAVTFTNKATDEMKRRILKELHTLSINPSKSPYKDDFIPSLFSSEAALKKKAEDILMNDMAQIPIYTNGLDVLIKPNVKNLMFAPTGVQVVCEGLEKEVK